MYLLDSDSVSLFLHHRGQQPYLEQRILTTDSERLWISIITVEEAIAGAYKIINKRNSSDGGLSGCRLLREVMRSYATFQMLPFSPQASEIYRNFPAVVKRIGKGDCKIAAIALEHDLTVITRNVSDFRAIPAVKFEDWTRKQIITR